MIITIFILSLIGVIGGYITFLDAYGDSLFFPPTILSAITIITAWHINTTLGITLCTILSVFWAISTIIIVLTKLND